MLQNSTIIELVNELYNKIREIEKESPYKGGDRERITAAAVDIKGSGGHKPAANLGQATSTTSSNIVSSSSSQWTSSAADCNLEPGQGGGGGGDTVDSGTKSGGPAASANQVSECRE